MRSCSMKDGIKVPETYSIISDEQCILQVSHRVKNICISWTVMFKLEEVIHRGMSHAARQVHYFAWLESTKNFAERKLWIRGKSSNTSELLHLSPSENWRLLSAHGFEHSTSGQLLNAWLVIEVLTNIPTGYTTKSIFESVASPSFSTRSTS